MSKVDYFANAGNYLNFENIPKTAITTWIIGLILMLVLMILASNLKIKPESKRQLLAEIIVIKILDIIENAVSDRKLAERYMPLVGSFFIYIIISNYVGLLPFMDYVPGFSGPTTHWSVTMGLALIVFFMMFILGIKKYKLRFFKRFINPLNIVDTLIKPISLSLRLFGSVYAEEIIIATIFSLVPLFAPIIFQLIALFFGYLQAMIFTMLGATYLQQAESEE